jgi:hypothetical protein
MNDHLDATAVSPEDAVRRYLQFIEDPATARDEALLTRLRHQLASASDPIEKLHLLTQIGAAESATGDDLRTRFVRHAKSWADAHNVSSTAFRQLGVPSSALVEAGFTFAVSKTPKSARSAKPGRAGAARPAGGERKPQVSASSISSYVLGLSGQFTIKQIMDNAGGSLGTVNRVLDDLIANGRVRKLGHTDPNHTGRGRAPYLYERIS